MTPESGKVGSKATLIITSTAFPIGGDYKLRWSPTAAFMEDDTVVIAEGTVPLQDMEVSVTFTIPEAKYDRNYIQYARLARDDPVNMPFFVKPSIEVIPKSAIPGTTVKIKGTGFPEDDSSILSFDGKKIDLTITPNEIGTFIANYTIPETIAGKHKFIVDNPNVYDEITEVFLEVKPFITMDPEQPEIGTMVTITGRGFAGQSKLSIKYDDIVIADSPTTNEAGSFVYEFAVPETSESEHVITVSDEANNVQTYGLPLEGEPPPKPIPLKPKDDRFGILVFGKQTIEFSWKEVADTSGISYTVEIGENLNFFPLKPGMKKSELTRNICTFDIEPGTYYWRVRAVDGAGNAGEWAISPYPFKVGLLSIWSIVAGAVIFLIIFILLLRAFFRRLKEYY